MTDSRPHFAGKDLDSLRDLCKITQKVGDRTWIKTSLITLVLVLKYTDHVTDRD